MSYVSSKNTMTRTIEVSELYQQFVLVSMVNIALLFKVQTIFQVQTYVRIMFEEIVLYPVQSTSHYN